MFSSASKSGKVSASVSILVALLSNDRLYGLLLMTLVPMAAIQGSVTHVSSDTTFHNDITIDGTIGADWDDGDFR